MPTQTSPSRPERSQPANAAVRGKAMEGPSRAPSASAKSGRAPRRPAGLTREEWAFSRQYGTKLHRARTHRKLSQDALAGLLHVSRNTIQRWESGRSLLSHYDHERLALAIQAQRGELL